MHEMHYLNARNALLFCLRLLHGTVATKRMWQEILTPSTLALSCKVVHEKLWKNV